MYIKKKLPLFMALITAIPLIILTVIIYFYSSSQLIKINKSKIDDVVSVESENISVVFRIFSNEIDSVAKNSKIISLLTNGNEKTKQDTLEYIKSRSENVYSNYFLLFDNSKWDLSYRYRTIISNLEGDVILDTSNQLDNTNISSEEFFKKAIQGRRYMKPVFYDENSSHLLVSVPIIYNSKILGVYTAYFDIQHLGLNIFRYEVGKGRYTYIADINGILLYHPDRQRIGTRVENKLVNEIIEKIRQGQNVEYTNGIYEYRGTKKYMSYKYLKDVQWIIVVAQDLSEVYAVARNIAFISFFILTLFLILSVSLGLNFSNGITNPLTALMKAMKAAEDGVLDAEFNYSKNDEFGVLSKTYNSMMSKLRSNYQELEALYEELAATEEELRAQYDTIIESEEQLRISEERYRIALEAGRNGIFEWNITNDFLFLSEQFQRLIGYDDNDIKMKELIDKIILEEDKEVLYSAYNEHLNNKTKYLECEVRVKTGYNSIRWMYIKGRIILAYMGEQKILSGSLIDITERKEYEENIKYLAYYDSLTDLPNRRYFIEELEKELTFNDKKMAVFLLDLDNFKKVNDSLGHDKEMTF